MLRQALKEAGCSDAYRGGRNGEPLYFRASASVALMGVLAPNSLVSERPQQLGRMIERVRNGLSAIEEPKVLHLY
ncbi:hypothetical protein D3C86_1237790 [compost metagenome]